MHALQQLPFLPGFCAVGFLLASLSSLPGLLFANKVGSQCSRCRCHLHWEQRGRGMNNDLCASCLITHVLAPPKSQEKLKMLRYVFILDFLAVSFACCCRIFSAGSQMYYKKIIRMGAFFCLYNLQFQRKRNSQASLMTRESAIEFRKFYALI